MKEYKELSCREVGVDCDFKAEGETLEEVIQQCIDHAVEMHGMKGFGRDLYAKMRAHVRIVRK